MVSLNAHFWNISEKDKDCNSFWTTQLALTGLCFSDLSMGRVPNSLMEQKINGFRRKSSTPCSSVTQIPLLSSSFLLFASRAQHSSFEPLYPGDDGSFDFFKWNMLFHKTRGQAILSLGIGEVEKGDHGNLQRGKCDSEMNLEGNFPHLDNNEVNWNKEASLATRNLQTWFVNQSTNGSSMLARSFKHKNSRLLFHLCIFLLHFGLNRNAFDSLNDSFTAKLDMNILSRSTNFRYEEQSSG